MAKRGKQAEPPGRTTMKSVRDGLARGWPAGLTLLSGEDLYHLDAAQRALLGRLVPSEATDFALTIFGEGKVEIGAVISAARSIGMFAPARVVLVRDVNVLEGDPAPLVDFAERPPANAYLIVRAPRLDRRRKLHQALVKSGKLFVFGTNPDACSEVKALAQEKEMKLDSEAIGFLASICGGDLYRIDSELEKLKVAHGPDGPVEIDLAAARESAAGSGLLSGWEVADALLVRDASAALESLRRMESAGEEPLKLIGGLAYRARAMLRARAMVEGGRSPYSAGPAAGLWGMDKSKIARGLSAYEMDDVLAFPSVLLAADRDLKSRGIAGSVILESAVERLISGVAGPKREAKR